jgi:L-ascorbate metabolism protein UlaG (beta-lactamase superfamily)
MGESDQTFPAGAKSGVISIRQIRMKGSPLEDPAEVDFSVVRLRWLGQAGFMISCGSDRVLIDPYLSDSLAVKYAGREFPHRRLMPPPIEPGELRGINGCLCTHSHSDHLDPGTIPSIALNNPECRFVVPKSAVTVAMERGVPSDRILPVDAGESVALSGGMNVRAVQSAHEELAVDERGYALFLGYCLTLGGITFYHSGDCIPYNGLSDALRKIGIDVALLPVNGRDEYRRSRKVPGNFTMAEAAALCREASIRMLVPHHWGMFDFNTASEDELKRGVEEAGAGLNILLPDTEMRYEFTKRVEK